MINLNLKEYFDSELKSTLLHTIAGFIAGYVSFNFINPVFAVFIMLVGLGLTYILVKFLLKINKDKKWWLGNGIFIYIFTWFVVWTIFYNIG